MAIKNDIRTIDANVLLDYILQDTFKDSDRKKRVNKFFNLSNKGELEIRIFVYTLGEVFKRLLEPRDGNQVNLDDTKIQRLKYIQQWINEDHVVPVKMDSLGHDFFDHYKAINEKDSLIQQGDKLTLAAFCADNDSKFFYSFDRGIIQSLRIQEYIGELGKKVQEP